MYKFKLSFTHKLEEVTFLNVGGGLSVSGGTTQVAVGQTKMITSLCKQYVTLIKIFRATKGAVNQILASKVVYIHISLNANNVGFLKLVSRGDRCL